MKGVVIKQEPESIVTERTRVYNELIALGCSAKQASSLSYRLIPRKYLTNLEMIQLGYI